MQWDSVVKDINEKWTDIYYLLHYVHEDNITHQAIRLLQHIEKMKKRRLAI